jgi:hypothetical protein
MTDFDAIRSAAASSGSSSTDVDDSETLPDVDFGTAPRVSCFPEVIFDAEAIVGFDFIGSVKDEQNIRGPNLDWQEVASFAITLKNPEVVAGALWKDSEYGVDDEDRGRKYKLVGMDGPDVGEAVEKEGDDFVVSGVEYVGNKFEPAEQVEGFTETAGDVMDDDELDKHPMLETDDTIVQLFYDEGRGQRVGNVLDRLGGESAYYFTDEDGDRVQTKGLFEYPPTYGSDAHEWGTDPYPRVVRTGDIRTDVSGEPVRMMRLFGEDPTESDGYTPQTVNFLSIDAVGQEVDTATFEDREYTPVESTDEDRFPQGEPLHNGYLVWHDRDDSTSEASVEDATDDMDVSSDSPLASAVGGDDGDDSGQPSYEDLDAGWQEFIDEAAENGLVPETFDESEELPDWKDAVEQTTREEDLPVLDHVVLGDILEAST